MDEALPLVFHLSQNYPNPFRARTRITYCVAYRTRVRLTVLNPAREVIETLVDEVKSPGTYEVDFAARVDAYGEARMLASGNYYYRLDAGDYTREKAMEIRA